MREILFRGKRIDNGGWVYGDLLQDGDLNNFVIVYFDYYMDENGWQRNYCQDEIIPKTVGQYTGLLDKNGTEIFEGDIVKWFGKKYTVVYKDGRFIGEKEHFIGVDEYEFINLYGALEVIGNIHDNTEPPEEE